jgi:hypothetical protein
VLPVLFTLFGVPIQSYGVSKALAALVAGWLLGRLFARRGLNPDDAYTMTFAGAVWGFVGAKAYCLLEHLPNLTWHDLGSSGFTWYGGFLAGVRRAGRGQTSRTPAGTGCRAGGSPTVGCCPSLILQAKSSLRMTTGFGGFVGLVAA